MEIQIDQHTLERAEERGINENEIIDVINKGRKIGKRGQGKRGLYY